MDGWSVRPSYRTDRPTIPTIALAVSLNQLSPAGPTNAYPHPFPRCRNAPTIPGRHRPGARWSRAISLPVTPLRPGDEATTARLPVNHHAASADPLTTTSLVPDGPSTEERICVRTETRMKNADLFQKSFELGGGDIWFIETG